MAHKKKGTNKKQIVKKSNNWLFLLPVLIVAAVLPLVMKMVYAAIGSDVAHLYPNEHGSIADVFSYQKASMLIALAVFAVFFAIAYLLQQQRGVLVRLKNTESIGMGVFTVFTLLSAIVSGMPSSWMGYPYRYEGALVTVAYAVLFYCMVLITDEEKTLRILTYCLGFMACILCVVGLFQYFGMDLFRTDFGKMLMWPGSTAEQRDALVFNFGKKTIYATLFNPNNVGSMTAMLSVLFPVLGAFAKKIWQKVLYFVLSGLSVCTLIGCQSRAGYVGAVCGAVAAAALIVIACRKNKKQLFSALAQFLVIIMIFVGGWSAAIGIRDLGDGSLRENLPNVDEKASAHVVDIQTYETSAMVETNAGKLYFDFMKTDGELDFTVTDSDGKKMAVRATGEDAFNIDDPRFEDIKLQPSKKDGQKVVQITAGTEYPFIFVYGEERGMEVVLSDNRRGKTDHDCEYIELLDRYRTLGSGRGYIWSRSIPMLKKTLILGHGPDMFAVHFPQNEIEAKIDIFGINYMLVDKPHNTYLQYGINNGCVALLGFLTCCAAVLLRALRSVNAAAKAQTHTYTGYLVAAGGAVVGYLGAGMFNDSIVSVAPVFFILLGALTAAGRLAKAEAEQAADHR